MSKGKLIAIEGLDGSGKATQAKLLAGYLLLVNLAGFLLMGLDKRR